MGRSPSVKEVARHAGVSVGTVSNVLNRPDLVAEQTRARVQKAIADLGFVRNDSARQLRAGKSRTIGLVVLDVANPFFTDVARGVEEAANEQGMAVVLCDSAESAEKEASHLDLLAEMRVQGVLINPVEEADGRVRKLRQRGTPVVLYDRRGNPDEECAVAVDDAMGGRLAVEHLLSRGHRKIIFVGGPMTLRQVAERYTGAEVAIKASGVAGVPGSAERGVKAALEVLETPGLNVATGRVAGEEIARRRGEPTPLAVFCANDLVAFGVLQAMTKAGLKVPDDVAIIGYDDIEFAAAAAVPLSSVRQPRQLLGRRAADLLLDETTDSDHQHQQLVFEPELVVRDST